MLFGQRATQPVFEKLCQAYSESPSVTSQKALIAFCERNENSSLAGLGYFLIGFTDHQKGNFDTAVKFFEAASSDSTPLGDYLYYYWAESLYKLGEWERSREKLVIFLNRHSQSPLKQKALMLFWEVSLQVNQPQSVIDSVKSQPRYSEDPDALFYLAEGEQALNRSNQALASLQRLYYFFPLYRKSSVLPDRIASLLQSDPGLKTEIPLEWRLARVEKLYSGKRFGEATRDLENLFQLEPKFANDPQFLLKLGVSQFGAGDHAAAIQTLERVKSNDSEIEAQAWFYIGESYRKLDNYSSFKQSVAVAEQRFPKSKWLEEVLFSIGNYNLVRRNLDESKLFYQKIVDLFAAGRRLLDAHWRVAWYYYRVKEYERAAEMFIEHLTRFGDSDHRAAALYWTGRCKENLGQPGDAYQIYQAIQLRFINGYYGQLARNQMAALQGQLKASESHDLRLEKILKALAASRPSQQKVNLSQLQAPSLESLPRVQALAMIQLFDLAAREFLEAKVKQDPPKTYIQAAQLFCKGKNFHPAISNLRKVWPDYPELPSEALPEWIWKMFFPAEFNAIIFREAEKHEVDPYLIFALIRQESTFDPKALSKANAYGLMQLLPSTARTVARQMKLRRPALARLYDPDTNIRLGTKHLADLLQKFNGQEDKALAGYNAGVHRVDLWMSDEPFEDSAEFVETIPFTETRNYVKSIYRNYWFYKTLYGPSRQASKT